MKKIEQRIRCIILTGLIVLTAVPSALADETARDLLEMGRLALDRDDPYAAVDAFRLAIRANPAYGGARLGMAEALFLLGEYEEAFKELEAARPYLEGDGERILLEARILTALRRYPEAESLYGRLLDARPHDPEARGGLAELQAILGHSELAAESYQESLRYDPGNRRVLLQLVLLYDEERSRDRAENALAEALRLYPDALAVHIQAAEHYALYHEWERAMNHVERARELAGEEPRDPLYRRLKLLDAAFSLRRGDPAAALDTLHGLPQGDAPDALFPAARAHRDLGNEAEAQNLLRRLLAEYPQDEVSRIFREDPLIRSFAQHEQHRKETASWHLARGRSFEKAFYYDRALSEYRWARLLDKTAAEPWLAYADLIRKKGYTEKYRDVLEAALIDLPSGSLEHGLLTRRKELLEHSASGGLNETWGVNDPWDHSPLSWRVTVGLLDGKQSLPLHEGAVEALARHFAYSLEENPNITVIAESPYAPLDVRVSNSFADAFRDSRDRADFFLLLELSETERSFVCSAGLYLAHSGEIVARADELRTGEQRVMEALKGAASSLIERLPLRAAIRKLDGERVLLDKGRWHGVETGSEWILLKRGEGRLTARDGGVFHPPEAYLGVLTITETGEILSEGRVEKTGDFTFLEIGDEAFLSPIPENLPGTLMAPDPAFRARLLSIP